jgi:hypothetical protein
MATLYRFEANSLDHDPWLTHGESVVVEGRLMVRLGFGSIVPADGFHDSVQAAKRDCAEKLSRRVQAVMDRIASLRAESEVQR